MNQKKTRNKVNLLFVYFKSRKLTLLFLPLLSFLTFSCERSSIKNCNYTNQSSFTQTDLCHPIITTYSYGLEAYPIPEQISILKGLQMDGLVLEVTSNTLNKLDLYYETCEIKTGEFHISDIFTTIDLNQNLGNQLSTIDQIYNKIQFQPTILQVIFVGQKGNTIVKSTVSRIAEIANRYGKNLIIYPHDNSAIETAEEALYYIELTNKNNVFLSIHLCHELAAGNGYRIEEVITKASPFIKSVSISGASESEQNDSSLPLWYWGIKPLNHGTYNYTQFYKSLYKVNYIGPIAIHSWGILNNFGLRPMDHIPISRQILLEIATDLCI